MPVYLCGEAVEIRKDCLSLRVGCKKGLRISMRIDITSKRHIKTYKAGLLIALDCLHAFLPFAESEQFLFIPFAWLMVLESTGAAFAGPYSYVTSTFHYIKYIRLPVVSSFQWENGRFPSLLRKFPHAVVLSASLRHDSSIQRFACT